MKTPRRRFTPTWLPSLRRRAAYSLAAGAAGAASHADAAISHSGPQNIAVMSGFSQNINFDGDAFQDINFQNFNFLFGAYQGAGAVFSPGKLVGFNAGPSSYSYVSALTAGQMIDASSINIVAGSMAYGAGNPNALFNNITNAYVGIGFPAGSDFFYGWVRVDVNNAAKSLLIKDWAYQTTSNVGIPAGAVPEPGTLGLLAAGAAGVAVLRRRRPSPA